MHLFTPKKQHQNFKEAMLLKYRPVKCAEQAERFSGIFIFYFTWEQFWPEHTFFFLFLLLWMALISFILLSQVSWENIEGLVILPSLSHVIQAEVDANAV